MKYQCLSPSEMSVCTYKKLLPKFTFMSYPYCVIPLLSKASHTNVFLPVCCLLTGHVMALCNHIQCLSYWHFSAVSTAAYQPNIHYLSHCEEQTGSKRKHQNTSSSAYFTLDIQIVSNPCMFNGSSQALRSEGFQPVTHTPTCRYHLLDGVTAVQHSLAQELTQALLYLLIRTSSSKLYFATYILGSLKKEQYNSIQVKLAFIEMQNYIKLDLKRNFRAHLNHHILEVACQ